MNTIDGRTQGINGMAPDEITWRSAGHCVRLTALEGDVSVRGMALDGIPIANGDWQFSFRFLTAPDLPWQGLVWHCAAQSKNELVLSATVGPVRDDSFQLQMRVTPKTCECAGLTFEGLAIEFGTIGAVPLAAELKMSVPMAVEGRLCCIQDLYSPRKAQVVAPDWGGLRHGNWQGQRSPMDFAANDEHVLWGRLATLTRPFSSEARYVNGCGPLFTYTFTFESEIQWQSPELAFLAVAQALSVEERKDLWATMFAEESERFRRESGIRHETVLPMANIPIDGGTPGCAPREQLILQGTFDEYGDDALQLCTDMSCRRLLIGSPWISQRTEGIWFKALPSINYDSRCGTIDIEISPVYGGRAAFRRFCDRAHERGVKIYCWYPAFHLSNFAPCLTQHPDWIVRKADGSPFTYVYFHISAISARSEVQQHFLKRLKEIKEECRFDGLWLDSYNTFPFASLDYYRRHGVSQVQEGIDMVRRFQELGIHVINEGFSPFGARGDGETTFFAGQEDMAVETSLFTYYSKNEEILSGDTLFRFLANKAPLTLALRHIPGSCQARVARWNAVFCEVVEFMKHRELLKDGRGVLWSDGEHTAILFAYTDGDFALPSVSRVRDLTVPDDGPHRTDTIITRPGHVYRVDKNEKTTDHTLRSPTIAPPSVD